MSGAGSDGLVHPRVAIVGDKSRWSGHCGRTRPWVVVAAILALLGVPVLSAHAADRTATGVVRQALGPGESITRVRGETRLQGLSMTAPTGLDTFVTRDAMIAVLPAGRDAATFGVGGDAQVRADGSVQVVEAGPGMRLKALLAAPWAKDATGRSLPTWYTVGTGHILVQHVDTHRAVFPIAADPRLTFGRGVYLNVTGAEAKAIASVVMAVGSVSASALCKGAVRLPSAASKLLGLLCPFIGGNKALQVFASIAALWKGAGSRSTFKCYQKRILGPSNGWHAVAMKNCTG